MTGEDIHTALCVAFSSLALWLVLLTVAAFVVDQVVRGLRVWRKRRNA